VRGSIRAQRTIYGGEDPRQPSYPSLTLLRALCTADKRYAVDLSTESEFHPTRPAILPNSGKARVRWQAGRERTSYSRRARSSSVRSGKIRKSRARRMMYEGFEARSLWPSAVCFRRATAQGRRSSRGRGGPAVNRLPAGRAGSSTGIAVDDDASSTSTPHSDIVPTQPLTLHPRRLVMVLCLLLFPFAAAYRNHIRWWAVIADAGRASAFSAMRSGAATINRSRTMPESSTRGARPPFFIVLLLEATRRSPAGSWPIARSSSLDYDAATGAASPPPWTHRG